MKRSVMIVAGEASGDAHAAKLVKALRDAEPGTEFALFGSAGPAMRDAGVEAVVEADRLSVVGLLEIASSLPMFLIAFRRLKRAAAERQPDVVVLVDFPEFNLKLARVLKRMGIGVVYYISPQLWAWRKYRLRSVRRDVDLMLTILPFEQEWYEQNGFDRVQYVGSPLAREIHPSMARDEYRPRLGVGPDQPLIAFLPGSREREISRILPVMLRSVPLISHRRPGTHFVVAAASPKHLGLIDRLVTGSKVDVMVRVGETYDVLNSCDAAAVTSGTATLEAGMLGCPMAIVYRTSALNYRLFEPMIDVPHYGLINLIAGKRVARELIQHEFTPDALADELLRLLEPDVNGKLGQELKIASESLGHGGASRRAAEAILQFIVGRNR